MATLYSVVLESINSRLGTAVDEWGMADRSYVKWEANGGVVDLQLPAFKLTNRQMRWLCLAHVYSSKFHSKYGAGLGADLESFLFRMQQHPSFMDAFQCVHDKK